MKPWWVVGMVLALALVVGGVYVSQERYKYACQEDTACYPCTRWMNCVSEGFYLENTWRCRIGYWENLSRISCGCRKGSCQTLDIKPPGPKEDVWVPGEG